MPDRLARSLTELENNDWGEPSSDPNLVTTIHQLRLKPIGKFTIEDLRITIGQNIGLLFLVPLALSHLKHEPLAEGNMYQGDLLTSVLRVDDAFWVRHSDLERTLVTIANRAASMSDDPEILGAFARLTPSVKLDQPNISTKPPPCKRRSKSAAGGGAVEKRGTPFKTLGNGSKLSGLEGFRHRAVSQGGKECIATCSSGRTYACGYWPRE